MTGEEIEAIVGWISRRCVSASWDRMRSARRTASLAGKCGRSCRTPNAAAVVVGGDPLRDGEEARAGLLRAPSWMANPRLTDCARACGTAARSRSTTPTASARSFPIPISTCTPKARSTRPGARFGAHIVVSEGVRGVRFAVWAPNAEIVSLAGEFNDWDTRRHPMRRRNGGVWEIFMPGPRRRARRTSTTCARASRATSS